MTYAKNKKAHFEYEILETLEAGIILNGSEVKAIRNGQVKLTGGFVTFHGNIPMLINTHISRYKYTTNPLYEPERSRKILLKKKEINYIRGKSQEQGLTIIPLSLYTKSRYIKLEIGIARGKKRYDKRRIIKKRDLDRHIQRTLKEQ